MKLLTAEGSYVDVSRRAWPMSGLNRPQSIHRGLATIDLAKLPSGEAQYATYDAIYRSNPWVWAAVNLISWGLSRMPVKVYQFDADAGRKQVRGDTPATPGRLTAGQNLDRVLRKPEPLRGRMHVFRRTTTDMLVFGNGLWSKDRGPSGIQNLWHVPWKKVKVQEGETTPILYYEIVGNRSRRQLIPEDVVHFSLANDPDTPVGVSPISALRYTLALHNAIQRHLRAFFENFARPSGLVKFDKSTPRDVLELMREELTQLYTHPESAGKMMMTTGEWQALTESPDQSSIIELVKLSREEVAAAYGVTPPLMGILDRAIMGNVRELRSHHLRDVIGPWAVLFEDDMQSQLLTDSPALSGHFVEFELGEHLRPDFEARAKAMRNFETTYTLNERRKIENLPPIDNPDADAVFLPLNSAPVGEDDDEDDSRWKRIGPSSEPADSER